VFGTDANRRKAMNFASKVNGMNACCSDQANATNTIARLVLRQRTWEAGYQIAVIGHLLGQPPNERKHQHAIESGRQDPKEIRGRERPIQEPTDPIDATKNEYEANWDEREAEQRIADETRSIEADKSGTATLALRE
jgi:hypothetical protein